MPARASPRTRIADALAFSSAGITLGAGAYALAVAHRSGPTPDEPLDAAAYNRRQAPAQIHLHLLLALTHPLMVPAALSHASEFRSQSASDLTRRISGVAAEASMFVSMLVQARAWRNLASLYDAALSDEERARTLDCMERANTIWTETAGVALWAASAAAAAVSLRRDEPWRAALSTAAAVVWIAQLVRPMNSDGGSRSSPASSCAA